MSRSVLRVAVLLIEVTSCLTCANSAIGAGAKKDFTVLDEIGLTHFGDPYFAGNADEITFSPDRTFFAVDTERGSVDRDRVEDSLRFYRSRDVEDVLRRPKKVPAPPPVWIVNRSGKVGPIITEWRWLADSSGVAFLEMDGYNRRLVLADLQKRSIEILTSADEVVHSFDIKNSANYVYTSSRSAGERLSSLERLAPEIVGTGRSIWELILPKSRWARADSARTTLWSVTDGVRTQVRNPKAPLSRIGGRLALSPDSRYVIATLPVINIPISWETLYPPPYPTSAYRIHAGNQNAGDLGSVEQYVRIDLRTGHVQSLTGAPLGNNAGWWGTGNAMFSPDGHSILLPNTFIESGDGKPSRPCVAVIDQHTRTCVERAKGEDGHGKAEEGYHVVYRIGFRCGDSHRITTNFYDHVTSEPLTNEYRLAQDRSWIFAGQSHSWNEACGEKSFEVGVQQNFNSPPRLLATAKGLSRVLWDPNPQLRFLKFGKADVFTWDDKAGRRWRGGLFKPADYIPGKRYPLVIQTHGFTEFEFRPSGVFPTAFAARALAAVGIVVLQVNGTCPLLVIDEGPCAVEGYEAAIGRLVSDGLVDSNRIGIIGFSRTCFYVMEELTLGSLHLTAASITDGMMEDYLQYILFLHNNEADQMMGAKPFGEGLQQWFKRSPGFNLGRISTPLLIVGEGPASLLIMWQPYAGLRLLHKPVDLIMLNTDEHILTNPLVRLASQGGSVDWFRFWLQSYEDPVPSKKEQYKRWHALREIETQNPN